MNADFQIYSGDSKQIENEAKKLLDPIDLSNLFWRFWGFWFLVGLAVGWGLFFQIYSGDSRRPDSLRRLQEAEDAPFQIYSGDSDLVLAIVAATGFFFIFQIYSGDSIWPSQPKPARGAGLSNLFWRFNYYIYDNTGTLYYYLSNLFWRFRALETKRPRILARILSNLFWRFPARACAVLHCRVVFQIYSGDSWNQQLVDLDSQYNIS